MSKNNNFKSISLIIRFCLVFVLFVIDLKLIYSIYDIIGVILGIAIFPVVFIATPFLAIFKFGNWIPLILSLAVFFLPPFIALLDDEKKPF